MHIVCSSIAELVVNGTIAEQHVVFTKIFIESKRLLSVRAPRPRPDLDGCDVYLLNPTQETSHATFAREQQC